MRRKAGTTSLRPEHSTNRNQKCLRRAVDSGACISVCADAEQPSAASLGLAVIRNNLSGQSHMVQQCSLLSPTLVLPSQDQHVSSSSQPTRVFGEPFRFGKPLCFRRETVYSEAAGLLAKAANPVLDQNGTCRAPKPISSTTTKKQSTGRHNTQRSSQVTHTAVSQQQLSQQCADNAEHQPGVEHCAYEQTAQTAATATAAAEVASKYFLGSLQAALSHGYASQTAAAAAMSATIASASQLATSPVQQPYPTCSNNSTSSCRHHTHRTRRSDASTLQHVAADPTAAAAAAAIAAAAACSGCASCRVWLQRLQRCNQCAGHTQLDTAQNANGSTTAAVAGNGTDLGLNTGDASHRTKRKACEVDDRSPGPGQYDLPSSFGQGVAFSIGSKIAAGTCRAEDDIPGPGSYYNPAGRACAGGPAFSIGGRWKEPGQEPAAPGPGEHQQLVYIVDGPAFSIAGKPGNSSKLPRSNSPGPGAYAPDWDRSTSPRGPAYSMAGRPQDPCTRSTSPGPAEYQTTQFKPGGPAFSIPPKPKARKANPATAEGPAPTDYDAASSVMASSRVKSAPAYSFSAKHASAIDQMFKELFPGPGSYYVSDTGPAGPAFSMGRRHDGQEAADGKAAEGPGPGDYHKDVALGSSAPAFSLTGRPNSPSRDLTNTQGPGMYYNPQAEAALQGSKAFTMGTRPSVGEAVPGKDSPGPASYNLPVQKSGPAVTIGSKPKTSEAASDGPGPASYVVKPLLPEGPCFTMGVKPRERVTADEDVPAVGEYEVVDTAGMAVTGPAWTMSSKKQYMEDKRAAEIPGPGQYHINTSAASGPSWTMSGKWADPAAGDKKDSADAVTPGPGEHHQEGWSSLGGPAFTISGRTAASGAQDDSPGPGAYLAMDYADPQAADAPAYTMGTRLAAQEPVDTLGPGAFDTPQLPKGPAFTMGGRPLVSAAAATTDAGPGPAAYDVATAINAVDASAPAWTMGQKQKEQTIGSVTPAPGDYDPDNPSAAAAPAWTMGSKAPADDTAAALQQQLQPGPGYYTPVDPVKDSKGAAYSIAGRWKEAAGGQEAGPAPGDYDMPQAAAGPAFTLAGRTTATSAADDAAATPSPGHYHQPLIAGSETPAYTMAARIPSKADAADTADVGPGSYDVAAAYTAAAAAAPAFSLSGKGKADGQATVAGADSPGVGAYDVGQIGPQGPAYSMGAKLPVEAKVSDGPSCVDYHTEGATTSTTPAAPAYTMGMKLPERNQLEESFPAPGTYHSAATAGAPPHAPAAPAYSIQGKHKKGKSRLRQMLGKLADIDAAGPGPGEHQPAAGGSLASTGPKYSFGPPVDDLGGADSAGGVCSSACDGAQQGNGAAAAGTQQTLAQLQAQLARLLVKETQRATKKASQAAANSSTPGGQLEKNAGAVHVGNGRVGDHDSPEQLSSRPNLASLTASVHQALLLSAAARKKSTGSRRRTSGGGQKYSSSKESTAPAPGDHHSATTAGDFGSSGPAYTMGTKGNDDIKTSVADADGFVAVVAAGAAADRAAAVPGPGMYHVEKPFPHPEGRMVYKPILKKNSSLGSSSKRVSFVETD